MKLFHFYHIYADGKWVRPVLEHLWAMHKGKLNRQLDQISVGIAGCKANRIKVEKFLRIYSLIFRLDCKVVSQAEEGWEQVTLDKLYEFSQDHDGYILYAHTKGAANNQEPNKSWRKSMTHFNVLHWKKAVEKLKDYQAVGCNWLLPEDLPVNGYYFAGNFWWTHLSLIRTLDKPLRTNRYEAEVWLGRKYKTNPFTAYDLYPVFPYFRPPCGLIRKIARKIKNFVGS
jgi:hypothetical protein